MTDDAYPRWFRQDEAGEPIEHVPTDEVEAEFTEEDPAAGRLIELVQGESIEERHGSVTYELSYNDDGEGGWYLRQTTDENDTVGIHKFDAVDKVDTESYFLLERSMILVTLVDFRQSFPAIASVLDLLAGANR